MVSGVSVLLLGMTSRSLRPSSTGSPTLSHARAIHASKCLRGISPCSRISSQLFFQLRLDRDPFPCRNFSARSSPPRAPALSLPLLVWRLHGRGRTLIVV